MIKEVTIIGGDLRIIKLAQILSKENYKVSVYGMDDIDWKERNIIVCNTLEQAINSSKVIISSIPFTKNGDNINATFSKKPIYITEFIHYLKNKIVIAGGISSELSKKITENHNIVIDLLQSEELTVLNAVATAEGAIQIALEETDYTLHGSKVLILGFGRIGKILAKVLMAMGVNVYCEARKESDIAWIKAYGYHAIELQELKQNLNQFDIIMNTVPFVLLDKDNLKQLKKECLIIDLASNPGGVDQVVAKKLGLKYIWALALPGKVAPTSAAQYIKQTLYHIFKEMEK